MFVDFAVSYAFKAPGTGQTLAETADAGEHIYELDQGQADPSKFRVDKKQNRLIYTYPQDGPWYELKYIADELPNSLEAEISGGNQLIMNYKQAQELFGIKFRHWLGIFNL